MVSASGVVVEPVRPVEGPGLPRWGSRVLTLALFAAASLVPLVRYRGRPSWRSLWGEDGHVFYQDAYSRGPGQLLESFSGYLSLPPRLVSELAVRLGVPIGSLALYYALSGVIITALLAWFVHRSTRAWVSSPAVRVALAALVVLAPAAGGENTASATNTIWAFAAAAPWAFISEEDGPGDVLIRAVIAFLAATATGLSFVLVPLALVWLWFRRSRPVLVVVSAFLVGAVVQAIVTLRAPAEPPPPFPRGRSTSDLLDLIGARVYAIYLWGDKGASALWESHGRFFLLCSTLLMFALFGLLARGAGRRAQAVGAMFFVLALLTFLVPVWGRGTTAFGLGGKEIAVFQHIRYSVVPTLMLGSGLAVLVAPFGEPRRRVGGRIGRPLFVAHVAIVIVTCFTVTGYRAEGPSWTQNVTAARTRCRSLSDDALVTIPQDQLHFWQVTVKCASLVR